MRSRPRREGPRTRARQGAWVYLLRCRDGSLYAGAAKDLGRRLGQHRAGTASRYTRARRPVRLVWSRRVGSWPRALRLERRIKQLSRAEKMALVAGGALRHPRPRQTGQGGARGPPRGQPRGKGQRRRETADNTLTR